MSKIANLIVDLKETKWGIASRIGNTIFVNKNLKMQDPLLFSAIIEHELSHSSGYSWKDIKLDLKNKHLRNLKKRYYKFILKNPKALVEFLPFWVYEHEVALNPLMLGVYGVFLMICGGILSILR